MPHGTTIRTNGQALTVNASVSHWTTEALALTASGTNDVESTTTTTIASDYTLWFANTATTAVVTVKQLDGTTLYTGTLEVNPGVGPRTISPTPDIRQVAADAVRVNRVNLAPPGTIAETIARGSGATLTNTSTLTSGRLYLTAIDLPQGALLTSITYVAATTALSGGTDQWFALYDSSRVLIRQTTNDTTTAWSANAAKTLALSSTFTTTYAGLHYVGIMVAAATPPTLFGTSPSVYVTGISPILTGNSTTGLTTTPPDPAGTITAAGPFVYAYVS